MVDFKTYEIIFKNQYMYIDWQYLIILPVSFSEVSIVCD